MKDKRLENEFEEYFQSVNISNDIIADAKASVKPKRNIMPKVVKFASIAASIVLVFAVTLTIMFSSNFRKSSPDSDMSSNNAPSAPGHSDESQDGETSAPDHSSGSAGGAPFYPFELYTDSDIVQSDISAYSISSLDKSLKFIENFALADNAGVEYCTAGYDKSDKLVLVKAKVNIANGLNRDETTVFVEFTGQKSVYDKLAEYYDGKISYYRGAQYYLTRTTSENGEPEFKLHILYNGVKYYFNVHSSDESAYEKYLNLIVK